MARASQPDSFALRRLLTILTLIPREPKSRTVAEIHGDLERAREAQMLTEDPVSRRTVERDLKQLGEAFNGLSCDESRRPHRWFWNAKAAAPAGVPMTPPQGLAHTLAREHLKHHLPKTSLAELAPFFDQAKRALAGSRLHDRWSEKIRVEGLGFHAKAPAIDDEIAAQTTEALLREKRLRVTYAKGDARDAREYLLHPLGLLVRDGVLTLVCTTVETVDAPSKGPFQMHLHRMRSATCLEDARRVPPGFQLRDYDAGGGKAIERAPAVLHVRLHVALGTPFWPEERGLPKQIVTKDATGTVVEADVPNSREFVAWLRGFGPAVKVLGPKELRAHIAKEVRDLAAYYGDGG